MKKNYFFVGFLVLIQLGRSDFAFAEVGYFWAEDELGKPACFEVEHNGRDKDDKLINPTKKAKLDTIVECLEDMKPKTGGGCISVGIPTELTLEDVRGINQFQRLKYCSNAVFQQGLCLTAPTAGLPPLGLSARKALSGSLPPLKLTLGSPSSMSHDSRSPFVSSPDGTPPNSNSTRSLSSLSFSPSSPDRVSFSRQSTDASDGSQSGHDLKSPSSGSDEESPHLSPSSPAFPAKNVDQGLEVQEHEEYLKSEGPQNRWKFLKEQESELRAILERDRAKPNPVFARDIFEITPDDITDKGQNSKIRMTYAINPDFLERKEKELGHQFPEYLRELEFKFNNAHLTVKELDAVLNPSAYIRIQKKNNLSDKQIDKGLAALQESGNLKLIKAGISVASEWGSFIVHGQKQSEFFPIIKYMKRHFNLHGNKINANATRHEVLSELRSEMIRAELTEAGAKRISPTTSIRLHQDGDPIHETQVSFYSKVEMGDLVQTRQIRKTQASVLHEAAGACLGLLELHQHGIAHKDVTGRNLLRTMDGRTLFTDFGTSLRIRDPKTGKAIEDHALNLADPENLRGTAVVTRDNTTVSASHPFYQLWLDAARTDEDHAGLQEANDQWEFGVQVLNSFHNRPHQLLTWQKDGFSRTIFGRKLDHRLRLLRKIQDIRNRGSKPEHRLLYNYVKKQVEVEDDKNVKAVLQSYLNKYEEMKALLLQRNEKGLSPKQVELSSKIGRLEAQLYPIREEILSNRVLLKLIQKAKKDEDLIFQETMATSGDFRKLPADGATQEQMRNLRELLKCALNPWAKDSILGYPEMEKDHSCDFKDLCEKLSQSLPSKP